MAVTRRDITDTLDSVGWSYHVDEEQDLVCTHCCTKNYSNNDKIPALDIFLHTIDNGRVLIVIAPDVRNVSHLSKVDRLSLHDIISDSLHVSKFVKCYMVDGCLRVRVEIPMEDADIPSVLLGAIRNVVRFVNVFIEKIDDVLSTPMEIDVPEHDEIIIMTRTEMIARFELYRLELDTAI